MKILSFLFAIVLMVTSVQAQETDIKSVISNQIQSFLKDDFATAFTYAAPNIKQIFGTPERFG